MNVPTPYVYFLDISAPAGQLRRSQGIHWVKELLCLVVVLGLMWLFVAINNRKYRLVPKWPTVVFRAEAFNTGDMVLSFNSGLSAPRSNNFFLNPGHVYLVVETGRYGQRFLWDLTFWHSPRNFKPFTPLIQTLLHKRVPVYAIHFHGDHNVLHRRCMKALGQLTHSLSYDLDVIIEHAMDAMEELAYLPCLRNPFVDVATNKRYCSAFVLHILVTCGVLHPRVLQDIPLLDTDSQQVQHQGGMLYYPRLMMHKDTDLNRHCLDGWSCSAPEELTLSA